MISFLLVVVLFANGLIWLPLLWEAFHVSAPEVAETSDTDLPCTLCHRSASSTTRYVWVQWRKDCGVYRFGWLCQPCIQRRRARPMLEMWREHAQARS